MPSSCCRAPVGRRNRNEDTRTRLQERGRRSRASGVNRSTILVGAQGTSRAKSSGEVVSVRSLLRSDLDNACII